MLTFQRIIQNLSAAAALIGFAALMNIIRRSAKCISFEVPNKKTVLIASENVRKSRKFHEKMKKHKKKTRGKSLKRGKKRRKCEKKKIP